jgi:hypothetical protein
VAVRFPDGASSFVTRPHVNFVEQVPTEKGNEEAQHHRFIVVSHVMFILFNPVLFGYLTIENISDIKLVLPSLRQKFSMVVPV